MAEIEQVVALINELRTTERGFAEASAMLADPEMRELAEAEAQSLKGRIPQLESEIQIALLPKDEADERSAILEIRPAAGGDEAGLFASQLFGMYQRYAEAQGWRFEIMEYGDTELGDRSERIRTYNFPQGRVTDHRINLTLYKIDRVSMGDLDEIIAALAAEDQAARLASFTSADA